jgi:hypothetical protein
MFDARRMGWPQPQYATLPLYEGVAIYDRLVARALRENKAERADFADHRE